MSGEVLRAGGPSTGYPRPVTSETFEAEFVAWNQFREAMGLPAYTRERFARIVAYHNATIARKSIEEQAVSGDIDRPAPEA